MIKYEYVFLLLIILYILKEKLYLIYYTYFVAVKDWTRFLVDEVEKYVNNRLVLCINFQRTTLKRKHSSTCLASQHIRAKYQLLKLSRYLKVRSILTGITRIAAKYTGEMCTFLVFKAVLTSINPTRFSYLLLFNIPNSLCLTQSQGDPKRVYVNIFIGGVCMVTEEAVAKRTPCTNVKWIYRMYKWTAVIASRTTNEKEILIKSVN